MTDQERIRAYALRLEGRTWQEIGEELGYTGSTVCQDLRQSLSRSTRLTRCPYPALADLIRQDYGGCISDFARACGIRRSIVYDLLAGRRAISPSWRRQILDAAGGRGEELFERRKDRVYL